MLSIFRMVILSIYLSGLAGNIIAFSVYSRKSFGRNSINIYCRALAIFDSLVILVQIPNAISVLFYNIEVYTTSSSICKFNVYASTFLAPISSWILVMFAIDKMLCVMFPTR